MGRKPSAQKINDRANMHENTYPNQERMESQPFSGNTKLSGALDSQLEIPLPLMHPNFKAGGVEMCHMNSLTNEQVNQEYPPQKKCSAFFIRKKSKHGGASVRRSERIKSGVVNPLTPNHGIEYIEEVIVSESEKDEPDTQMEHVLAEAARELEPEPEHRPEPAESFRAKNLSEKIEYVFQRVEALDKIIELLKSKVDENIGSCEASSLSSMNYRSMYIESQKKIEVLTDENQRLKEKLANALGKIEVYEKQNHGLIEVLDKMKDTFNVAGVSNLAKATEAALNASTQAIQNACSASAAKRMRSES
ncbi:hypothetical protein RJT34_20126 [Clitoria ternatea]|uniref:Uncharacterized protein n=1 Tax=Clitoria ternatea TaxID=43366 RepID=A0AAN9ISA7_CLITE